MSFDQRELAVPDLAAYEANLAAVHWRTPGGSREQLLAAHHADVGGPTYRRRYNIAWHMAIGAEQFAITRDWIFMIPPYESAGWGEYDPLAYAEGVAKRLSDQDTPQ